MGKFIIKTTDTGHVFHLMASNGECIATSQVYHSMEACKEGIASVQTNAPISEIEDQTVDGYPELKHPKFEVFEDKGAHFRFHLKATNGQIIAASQEYKEKAGCLKGIASVKTNAPQAVVEVEA